MKNRLLEISEEESRIREIKNSCETIIAEDIHISELSEEVLYGSRATWKARLDEVMKQDIDKRFIGKAFIYIVFWAILAKSLVTAWLCFSTYESGPLGKYFLATLNLHETSIDIYFIWGTNWGGGGLGGLANSFTFCGIGVALLGTTVVRFIVLLLVVCALLSVIRGFIMYLKSSQREKKAPKTGRTMIIVSFILILLFALSIVMMKNDYISKNQANPSKEQMVENTDGTVLTITGENWNDYFELVDEVKYDKNEKGEVTAVYQESWFDLKDEYQSRQKGIIVERYVGEEPYMYTYDELELISSRYSIFKRGIDNL